MSNSVLAPETTTAAPRHELRAAVLFWSMSFRKWVDCTVTAVQPSGDIQISCKPGYWMPLAEQDEKLRSPAAPEPPAKEVHHWSTSDGVGLGPRGSEALFAGKVQLLDEAVVSSAHGAVDLLNQAAIPCSEGFCVVYSSSTNFYILLYRSGREAEALSRLGLAKDAEVEPRSLGPKAVRDPRFVITPVASPEAQRPSVVALGGWSAQQNVGLGPRGAEAVFEGKARLLDEAAVHSMNVAVEQLNHGTLQCPEGYCVVFSASSEMYILMFRAGCEQQAMVALGLRIEAPTRARRRATLTVPSEAPAPVSVDLANLPVMVIAPGGGTRSNASVYSALNTKAHMKVRIAGQSGTPYDRYPPLFPDGHEAPNLESFASDLLSEGVLEARCLVFGSRGGQAVLPALWKVQGEAVPPSVIINGGCAMSLPQKPAWPVGAVTFLVLGGQDYFKGDMSDDAYFAKTQSAVPSQCLTCAILFVKEMAHMPKPSLLGAILSTLIKAVVTWKATADAPIEEFGVAVAALNRGGWSGRLAFKSAPEVWQDMFFP